MSRRESPSARAPNQAVGDLVSGNRVNLLERYDYPFSVLALRRYGATLEQMEVVLNLLLVLYGVP